MSNLNVNPDYLEKLATYQDQAAAKSASAATAADGSPPSLWWTHGVISGFSNMSAGDVVGQRRAAGAALAKAATDLAAKLRAAAQTYASVDVELRENLDNQITPR